MKYFGLVLACWEFGRLRQDRPTSSQDVSTAKVCHMRFTFESQGQGVIVGQLCQVQKGCPRDEQMYLGKELTRERFLQGSQPSHSLPGARKLGGWGLSYLDPLPNPWVALQSSGFLPPVASSSSQRPCFCCAQLQIHQHPDPSSW